MTSELSSSPQERPDVTPAMFFALRRFCETQGIAYEIGPLWDAAFRFRDELGDRHADYEAEFTAYLQEVEGRAQG